MPSGVVSPACSASVQQFLRGRSDSKPSTNALARRRGSTRATVPQCGPSGLEPVLPPGRIYAVTCGHRLNFCLHAPTITGGRTHSRTSLKASKSRVMSYSERILACSTSGSKATGLNG